MPVPFQMSILLCLSCYVFSVLPVLFWLSVSPVPAVLFQFPGPSCPGCTLLVVLPGCFILAVPSWLPCPGSPVLTALPCPGSPVLTAFALAVLSWQQSCFGSSAVLFWYGVCVYVRGMCRGGVCVCVSECFYQLTSAKGNYECESARAKKRRRKCERKSATFQAQKKCAKGCRPGAQKRKTEDEKSAFSELIPSS